MTETPVVETPAVETPAAETPAPEPQPPYLPESAMAVMAHPDDVEFSCAGTLARWARAGARISIVLLTSGDVGITQEGMTRVQAAAIREAEAAEAARIIGAAEIRFMREPDGMLEATVALRKKIVREIRRFRPEVVITGDPTILWAGEGYINHPDHRAGALVTVDAIFPAAGQPNLFEDLALEGLQAHKVRKVFVTNWRQGEVWESIDDTIDVKVAALRAHKSQMRDWDVEKNIKEWAAERARDHGMQYAEIYRVVTLESDEDWAKYKGSVFGRQ